MTDSTQPCTETILVVSTETALRELIRVVLRMNGYRVLEASNGEDALHLIESPAASVHLVLTDRSGPDLSGQKLAELVRSTYPAVKALLLSERIDANDAHEWAFRRSVTILPKPFNVEDLEQAVRETLDGCCPLRNPCKSQPHEAALSWTIP